MGSSAVGSSDAQDGAVVQLESLVEEAYRDPRRMRNVIERAYELGAGGAVSASAIASKLRRKAKVVLEFDGRSALLEMAAELEGM